ncbi:MAG: hypothetical protein ABIN05_00215 [candidate division WOR-3 bacterium]
MKILRKKIFPILVIILSITCAKDFKVKTSEYSYFFKESSTFIYDVSSWGDKYELVIEIKKMDKNLHYRYRLEDDTIFKFVDDVVVLQKSLENSDRIFMNLWDYNVSNLDDKISVFFSKKVFKDLVNKKEVTIDVGDGEEHLTFERKTTYNCVIDGKEIELKAIYATSDLFGYFWILDDERFPLILKMEVGYIIELKEINTK